MRAALTLSLIGSLAGALTLSPRLGLAERPAAAEVSLEARSHYERGLRLYAKKAYGSASVQLSLAYDIDPHPHIIYAWAQAERMDGNCVTALRLYREYMSFDLSKEAISAAQANVVRCQEILEEADQLGDDDDDDDDDVVVEGDDDDDDDDDQSAGTGSKNTSDITQVDASPWYHDGLSIALLSGAVLGSGVGIWAYSSALDIEDRAVDEPDDIKYEALRQQSAERRTTAAISAGVGGLSLVLALVRIGMLPDSKSSTSQVQLGPNRSGTGFVFSGRF